ncbi:MAG: leucine-rich repeat domain-containing protein [Clostridia bacterium]|nr:leucine-rich repeat domain-containing protein [Clostridia bacterium]
MSEPQEETTHQHIFGEWTTVKEPSCSEKGSKERSCECGEKETEILDPKHFYTEIVTVPTKTTDGYTTHTCSVCNDSYTDTVVPAIGSTGLAYEINEASRTCTVTGMGTCTDSEVAIPQIIDGYTVTAIGEKAFANCTTITSIKIPESVKSIGYRAFYGCSGITEITIPKSVTDIGTQIFYKCENLNKVYYNSSYSNRDNAFLNLSHINTIVFGGNTVPKEILYEHKFITEIVILDPVKSIENDAFWHCSNLTSVTILSNSITRIGGFTGCSSLTSFTIPDSVTTINSMAFCSCSSLTSITIPDSVTSIRNYAFKNCSSLTSITIPESVTSISEEMFMQCSSLKSIILHDAVTSIHYRAFWGCSSLTSIIIPNSVTYIGEGAFYETKNLESAYYEGTVSEWKNISFVHGLESTTGLSRICRYYSKTQPADTTYKYWHYVNGVPTEW